MLFSSIIGSESYRCDAQHRVDERKQKIEAALRFRRPREHSRARWLRDGACAAVWYQQGGWAGPLQALLAGESQLPGSIRHLPFGSVRNMYPSFWTGALQAQGRGRPLLPACEEPGAGSDSAGLWVCH